jgi:hypothetical protein
VDGGVDFGNPFIDLSPRKNPLKKRIVSAVIALSSLAIASPLQAHSGGTDGSGCHNNHSTGDYHCHGGGSSGGGRISAPSNIPLRDYPYLRQNQNDDRTSAPSNIPLRDATSPRQNQSRRVSTPNAACPVEEGGYNAKTTDLVNLRTGPSTASPIIAVLQPGTKLKIHSWRNTDDGGRWAWLTTETGKDGWAAGAYLDCL